MQTKILDFDFYKSASYLRTVELNAQIFEAIQILASLLDCTDQLINPKRNVKNHPAAKLWIGYEKELSDYIYFHIYDWYLIRRYNCVINLKNFRFLCKTMKINTSLNIIEYKLPPWITDELIQTHRSVLIQKEIERERQLIINKDKLFNSGKWNRKLHYRFAYKFENIHHYRNLWPDCPRDLKMRYDFRKE